MSSGLRQGFHRVTEWRCLESRPARSERKTMKSCFSCRGRLSGVPEAGDRPTARILTSLFQLRASFVFSTVDLVYILAPWQMMGMVL